MPILQVVIQESSYVGYRESMKNCAVLDSNPLLAPTQCCTKLVTTKVWLLSCKLFEVPQRESIICDLILS